MSRLQYALVPGTRSKCRRCGEPIRLAVTRAHILALILLGAALAAVLSLRVDSALTLAATMVAALLAAWAIEEWSWRRVPWVVDAKPAAASAREVEPAGG